MPAQDPEYQDWQPPGPNDVPVGVVVDQASPDHPVNATMRELWAYHAWMIRQPPRVYLPPALPVSNGLWPMGWTGGVDDPSGGAVANGLRNTWSNMDTLAYTQHVYRERRLGRHVCPVCNTIHQ